MMIATSSTFTLDAVPTPMNFSPIVATHNRAPKRTRNVSFSFKLNVRPTLHRLDYTPAEKRGTWLTMNELRTMKQSCRKLARIAGSKQHTNSSNDDGETEICFRGLEGRSTRGLIQRQKTKSTARNAVLCEQHRQREWGIDDVHQIADAYYACTEYPQVEAHMVALRDQSEAALLALRDSSICSLPLSSITNTMRDRDFRRKSMFLSCARGDSTRSIQSLASRASKRRVLTDGFFTV